MTAAVPAVPNFATSHAIEAFTMVAGVWKMFAMLTSASLQIQLDYNRVERSFHTHVFKPEVKNELVFVNATGSSFKLPVLLVTPKSVVGNTSRRTIRIPKVFW